MSRSSVNRHPIIPQAKSLRTKSRRTMTMRATAKKLLDVSRLAPTQV